MMSSKRAASRALEDLFELIDRWLDGDKALLRPYRQMKLGSMPVYTYNRRLKRFRKYGLLQKKAGTENVFVLTHKAKLLRRKAISKELRSDRRSTLIIFDIPEDKHNARDTLRRFLIRSGYTQMKRSAFISPFKVSENLKELIRELKLEKNVSFFSATTESLL